MDKDKFDKIIEMAKQCSKDDFLRFVTGIYGVDECVFDHIWEVPVIAPWEGDCLATTPLSTKTEDEILDIVDEAINNELGDAEGCFISLDKIADEFTVEELEEWQEKLDYNAIIVYNESKLQKKYKELVKENSLMGEPKTQEELEQIFLDMVKGVITHERCHLNSNYLITEVDKYIDEKIEISSSDVNGASLTNIEQSNIITSDDDTDIINKYNQERNEVLAEKLCQMMNNYKKGDSIEDCLFRIIRDRDGKSQIEKIEISSSEVNGASLTNIEQSNIITSGDDTDIINKYNQERNEVLVDTLCQMMNNYKKGDSIEDCLFRIIKDRNGKSQYEDMDDRQVLTMYTLFPKELTEWATFGAYDFVRENKLKKMILDVCGTDKSLRQSQLNKKVEEYVTTLKDGTLSDKQMEMLEMLGFSINRKIDKEDMKEVATSEKALGALSGSLLDVKAFIKSMQKDESINEQEKG